MKRSKIIKLFDLPISSHEMRRRCYSIKGIAPTLTANMGMGGGNVPWLLLDEKN